MYKQAYLLTIDTTLPVDNPLGLKKKYVHYNHHTN